MTDITNVLGINKSSLSKNDSSRQSPALAGNNDDATSFRQVLESRKADTELEQRAERDRLEEKAMAEREEAEAKADLEPRFELYNPGLAVGRVIVTGIETSQGAGVEGKFPGQSGTTLGLAEHLKETMLGAANSINKDAMPATADTPVAPDNRLSGNTAAMAMTPTAMLMALRDLTEVTPSGASSSIETTSLTTHPRGGNSATLGVFSAATETNPANSGLEEGLLNDSGDIILRGSNLTPTGSNFADQNPVRNEHAAIVTEAKIAAAGLVAAESQDNAPIERRDAAADNAVESAKYGQGDTSNQRQPGNNSSQPQTPTGQPAQGDGRSDSNEQNAYQAWADRFGEVVGQRLTMALNDEQWSVRMNLNPHGLGSIDIQLAKGENGLEAVLRAEDHAAAELLQEALPQLEKILAGALPDGETIQVRLVQPGDEVLPIGGPTQETMLDLRGTEFANLPGIGFKTRDGLDVFV